MSNWWLIKLDFGQSLAHFGELGIGLEETSERIRSDTLFSALAIAFARLYGGKALEDLLIRFQGEEEPPFRLSSTFIYHSQGDSTSYYLPRPRCLPVNYSAQDSTIVKDFKKLEFLPLDIWRKWYQSEQGFEKNDIKELKGKYSTAFAFSTLPKVSLDRITQASNLFHVKFVHYLWEGQKSGLYFLLYFPKEDKELEDLLKGAFTFLGEEGIGGERSGGAGRFEVLSWQTLSKEWKQMVEYTGNAHSTIALFWDNAVTEEFMKDSRYELQERGGWLSSPSGRQSRRKMVRMMSEGSVFREKPKGKLANVTPAGDYVPHQVYRSGICLSLPIHLDCEEKQ